jgi:hypothetical protein
VHDLAVVDVREIIPRVAGLRAIEAFERRGAKVLLGVTIMNLGTHNEFIPHPDTLKRLVTLRLESLGDCPSLDATPRASTLHQRFPVTLPPGGNAAVQFEVTVTCVNDPRRGRLSEDYRYRARVDHAVLDGRPDDEPENDTCPGTICAERLLDLGPRR